MRIARPKAKRLILLTGGAGYKGSTLCRELLFAGWRVRVLDCLMYGGRPLSAFFNHPHFEFMKGDINRRQDLERALEGVSDIVHLAAIVGDKPCERNPQLAIDINYKATQCLADLAKEKRINHFLFASTCSNYGIIDDDYPATEESELNPLSLYAETKIDCEGYLLGLAQSGRFYPTILRFGTGYGVSGRTRFDLTVNSFTYEAIKEKKIVVFAQESWRPYVHVRDMARIYCAMLKLPKERVGGRVFNAGWNHQNYTKGQIVELIREVIGGFKVDYAHDIEDRRSYRVDFSKLEKALKLSALMSVKEGVAELSFAINSGILSEKDFNDNKLK
jgi:nucleoside-diphosphate-sugar epimerase